MFLCYIISSHIILCPIVCEDTGHFPCLMCKVGVYSCLQIRETKFRDLTSLLRNLLHTVRLNSQLSNFFSLFYFDFFLPTIICHPQFVQMTCCQRCYSDDFSAKYIKYLLCEMQMCTSLCVHLVSFTG